jgi:hypothetical protein
MNASNAAAHLVTLPMTFSTATNVKERFKRECSCIGSNHHRNMGYVLAEID